MGQHVTEGFYEALMDRLGVGVEGHGTSEHRKSVRDAAKRVFRAWEKAEGSEAEWNPFDTTLDAPGATNYNSFGAGGAMHVRNYPSEAAGVDATARTLLESHGDYGYAEIVHALRDGDAEAAAKAIDASAWGSHGVAKGLGSSGGSKGSGNSTHRKGVQALQAFLAQHDHEPKNSRKGKGWDGIYGPGTRKALAALVKDGHDAIRDLQAFLAHHGHEPQNSRKDDAWDGIYGPGTKAAVAALTGQE